MDDPQLVKRMVLKRCVYGADKNPMAVELAKVALWLHTFTVGAPLSFIDHHLAAGDSLFGLWVRDALDKAGKGGGLHLRAKLDALYFILYGIFDPADPTQGRDDIRYIYSTFPIVERQDVAAYGSYRSRDLALAYINALIAGQPDAVVAG